MSKWYSTAAISGSGFEDIADRIFSFEELDHDLLSSIDLLFIKDLNDFFQKFRLFQFIALSNEPIPADEQESYILLNPGPYFLSRIGHDLINLFTPFEQFSYLEEKTVANRLEQGLKFGRQINIAGHLLQNTKFVSEDLMTIEEFVYTVKTASMKKGVELETEIENNCESEILGQTNILNVVIDEIINNCKIHSDGESHLKIKNKKHIFFSNRFKGSLSPDRAKARLRWPFMKTTESEGNGLGLFILSLASVRGGFKWDINIKENIFSLLLSF